MERAINAVKDGYVLLADGVSKHPHITIAISAALILLAWVV